MLTNLSAIPTEVRITTRHPYAQVEVSTSADRSIREDTMRKTSAVGSVLKETLPAALTAQLLLRRTGNWSRWLRRHWGEIDVLEAFCSLESIAGRPRLHAQVCITLGHVLPCDLRVELLPAGPLADGHPLSRGRAMFSVAVQSHGRYWFAVNAPAEGEDAERDWVVRISPSRPTDPEIQPIVRRLKMVPAGTRRRSA
jgi:hypothetical protein